MSITAEQCRAARAMLQWSQEDLEARSGVAKKTIADFERGAQIPYDRTLKEVTFALEAAGVTMIPENGGGVGVRMNNAIVRLTRRRVSRFDRVATLAVSYRGKDYRVQLSTNILDDMDRTNHPSEKALEGSADRYMNMILIRTAAAIDAGRATSNGELQLTAEDDFPEA